MFKKNTIILVLMLTALNFSALKAQVMIGGTNSPNAFSLLELQTSSVKGGFQLPRLTQGDINAMVAHGSWNASAAKGLVVFNLTTNCVNTWDGSSWIQNCGAPDVTNYKAFPVISGAACGGVLFNLDPNVLGACNLYAGNQNVTYVVDWEVKSNLYATIGGAAVPVTNKPYQTSGFNGSSCYAVFQTNEEYPYEKISARVMVTFSDGTNVDYEANNNGVDGQGFLQTDYGQTAVDQNVLSGINCYNVAGFNLQGQTKDISLKNIITGETAYNIDPLTVKWTVDDPRQYLNVNVKNFDGSFIFTTGFHNTTNKYGSAAIKVSYIDSSGCNYQKTFTINFTPSNCCPSYTVRNVDYPTLKVNNLCWMTVYFDGAFGGSSYGGTYPQGVLRDVRYYTQAEAATACNGVLGASNEVFDLPTWAEFQSTVAYIDSHVDTYADLSYTPNVQYTGISNIMSQTQEASNNSNAYNNRGRSKPSPDGLDLYFTGRPTTNYGLTGNLHLKDGYITMIPNPYPTTYPGFPATGYEFSTTYYSNSFPIRCIHRMP